MVGSLKIPSREKLVKSRGDSGVAQVKANPFQGDVDRSIALKCSDALHDSSSGIPCRRWGHGQCHPRPGSAAGEGKLGEKETGQAAHRPCKLHCTALAGAVNLTSVASPALGFHQTPTTICASSEQPARGITSLRSG